MEEPQIQFVNENTEVQWKKKKGRRTTAEKAKEIGKKTPTKATESVAPHSGSHGIEREIHERNITVLDPQEKVRHPNAVGTLENQGRLNSPHICTRTEKARKLTQNSLTNDFITPFASLKTPPTDPKRKSLTLRISFAAKRPFDSQIMDAVNECVEGIDIEGDFELQPISSQAVIVRLRDPRAYTHILKTKSIQAAGSTGIITQETGPKHVLSVKSLPIGVTEEMIRESVASFFTVRTVHRPKYGNFLARYAVVFGWIKSKEQVPDVLHLMKAKCPTDIRPYEPKGLKKKKANASPRYMNLQPQEIITQEEDRQEAQTVLNMASDEIPNENAQHEGDYAPEIQVMEGQQSTIYPNDVDASTQEIQSEIPQAPEQNEPQAQTATTNTDNILTYQPPGLSSKTTIQVEKPTTIVRMNRKIFEQRVAINEEDDMDDEMHGRRLSERIYQRNTIPERKSNIERVIMRSRSKRSTIQTAVRGLLMDA